MANYIKEKTLVCHNSIGLNVTTRWAIVKLGEPCCKVIFAKHQTILRLQLFYSLISTQKLLF